jgi:predicted nucleic acid-binding protein
VNVVIDSCSVINLHNVDALDIACRLTRCRFWVCPSVLAECRAESAARLLALNDSGLLSFINDREMPAARVLDLLAQHGLGDGETQAVAACEAFNFALCSDDGPARRLATQLLGADRVLGSLRVLRWCVQEELVKCRAAFQLFVSMRELGGFLPSTRHEFFCSGTPGC